MDAFLNWFFEFITTMFGAIWEAISAFFMAIVQIFNLGFYFDQIAKYSQGFGGLGWFLAILSFLLVYAIWGAVVFTLVLVIRKYVRFRRTIVGKEDLLEEISDLHRDVLKLTAEKERILTMKIGPHGITEQEIKNILYAGDETAPATAAVPAAPAKTEVVDPGTYRFYRLSAVDDKYLSYIPPEYISGMSLSNICEDIRNFACSRSQLYYDIKTIRLMLAGLASTKLIILQGISGTGKTSLPYMMGKYFKNDSTIVSVQPSWRDRTELFGYFNEFTKKFNETEVLKRIYESSYNDDINIIILDEMNIARVEYYFAEMLSVLEMPDPKEWKIEIVPSSWETDPKHLKDGKITIPQNVWYIGTANNDDSTFAISDKVYDRALVINLDAKGVEFEAPDTQPKNISYSYIEALYNKAIKEIPVSDEVLAKIVKLDIYVIEKLRIAFGNRIMKQLKSFVPVYVACGGTENEAIDYILATKVFRKFEGLNLALIRDELRGLITFLDTLFGKGAMKESIEYLQRLQKMI